MMRPRLITNAALLGALFAAIASAQSFHIHVTYVCNGEHIVVDGCNIRDLSDNATCTVGHPDKVTNGLMGYSSATRAALKKLLPTCQQPSADEIARAEAFDKKVADRQAALEKKANAENDAIEARAQAVITGKKPQSADEKAINRCITAGRLPATCMGNALAKPFDAIVGSILPSVGGPLPPGPHMGGNFEGKGSWRIEFEDRAVMMKCAGMDLDQHNYSLSLANNRATITIDSTPKPVVLTVRPDGTLAGPGPITVNGIIYRGNHVETNVYGPATNVHEYQRVTRVCEAPILSSKGAAPSAVNMATGVLTGLFSDGEKGPPTPPGLRMHGAYGGAGGISLEFFPESVIIGCGDAARAYPYEVQATGTQTTLKIADPARPVVFVLKPDGELAADAGPYEVHGRIITGKNANDDFTFAPFNMTCNLGVLKPGVAASAPPPITRTGPAVATPAAPTGGAILIISSGFPAQPGVPNPLAVHPYVLLRHDLAAAMANGGFPTPPGSTALKVLGATCGPGRTPDCQRLLAAIDADAASSMRSDVNGKATLPGVPPGSYYLMISAIYNRQPLFWGFKVDLKEGPNLLTLDPRNAAPVN